MATFADEILAFITDAGPNTFIQQVLEGTLGTINASGEPQYPSDFVEQGIRGYIQMIRESLHGGSEIRRAFTETAIPGAVVSRGSAAKVVSDAALFTSLLGGNLLCRVSEERRPDAVLWFAQFASHYLRDVAVAAFEAERELAG